MRLVSIGDFSRTIRFLKKMHDGDYLDRINACCERGVVALKRATPVKTGKTADSWTYDIRVTFGGLIIYWNNSNVVDGFNVAIGLQYGHGTGTGGYVSGLDYINPAIRPVFEKIADDVWQEVVNA